MTQEVWDAVQWWTDWRAYKVYPFEGDVLDQPVYVYQVINTAEAAHKEYIDERQRQQNAGTPATKKGGSTWRA